MGAEGGWRSVRPWWLACLLMVFTPGNSAGVVRVEDLEKISHEIVYVNSFGKWQHNKQEGFYRVVLLDAHADFPHSKIYLQWVASTVDADQNDQRIVATASIAEINNASVFKLSVPKITSSSTGYAVDVTAINQYTQAVQNFRISPAAFSEYTLGYTAVPYASTVDQAVNTIPPTLDYYVRPTF